MRCSSVSGWRRRPIAGSGPTRAVCGGASISPPRSSTSRQVLFLDEPTTGLDPVSRKAIWEEVTNLNDEGTTVFLTTQYLEEADLLANRVGIIAAGEIVAEDTPKALKAEIGNAHVEIAIADGKLEGASEAVAELGKPMPSKDGLLLLELAEGAAGIAPVVRALDDAGFAVESLGSGRAHARRRLRRQDGPAPRGRGRRAGRRSRARGDGLARGGQAPGQRPCDRGARRPFDQADLSPPAADRADHRLPDAAAGGADRRGRARRRPSRLPRGQRLPRLHARRSDDPVDPARRQQRRHRARRRHRDGLHRPPDGGADLALLDRPRPARRDRRARLLLGPAGSSRSASSSAPGSRRASPGR